MHNDLKVSYEGITWYSRGSKSDLETKTIHQKGLFEPSQSPTYSMLSIQRTLFVVSYKPSHLTESDAKQFVQCNVQIESVNLVYRGKFALDKISAASTRIPSSLLIKASTLFTSSLNAKRNSLQSPLSCGSVAET